MPGKTVMNRFRNNLLALVVAAAGLLVVLSRIDCGGTYPTLTGPGLTHDEPYNVEQGVYLTDAIGKFGFRTFTFAGAAKVFDDRAGYNPDHPPLGRILLGLVHTMTAGIAPGAAEDQYVNIAAGRVGSAFAFAVTLFMITSFAVRKLGTAGGIASGLALLMMPRVVGHAHFGALETIVGMFYAATVFCAAELADRERPPSNSLVMLVGILIALTMLTKIQGIFLPVAVVIWLLISHRLNAVKPLFLMGGTAAVVFFVLWPWLWLEPVDHVMDYLGRTTERKTVNSFYFGNQYGSPPPADGSTPPVPWHYTLVTFAISVPLGLQILGCFGTSIGIRKHLCDWHGCLLFAIAVPLAVFTITGTVYDGARLFLVAYPLWAIVIGVGFSVVWSRVRDSRWRFARPAFIGLFAIQSIGVFASGPFYLSYYNALVGGTVGANSLGLEESYWGEGATKELWEAVPEGSTVYVTPVLDMYRLESLEKYSPIIRQRSITLKPFRYDLRSQPGLLLLLHRQADRGAERDAQNPDWLYDYAASREPIYQSTVQGVAVATLLQNDGK